MQERRKYVRIPEKLQISYKVIPIEEKSRDYITKDISQGGIRFLVHRFLPNNSRLRIKLTLFKGSVIVEAVVRLVWIKELTYADSYEAGVEFTEIPQKAAELLTEFIKESLKLRE